MSFETFKTNCVGEEENCLVLADPPTLVSNIVLGEEEDDAFDDDELFEYLFDIFFSDGFSINSIVNPFQYILILQKLIM